MHLWKKELTVSKPKELEQISRDAYIQRRNIKPYEREGINGETESGWECESRIVTMEELQTLKAQEEIAENQNIIMLALADIYETQKGGA